jgi:hypothetical protein
MTAPLRRAKVTTPKSVIRVWLPVFFGVGVCLFLSSMSPVYWLLALPLLPVPIFMIALAEVHDEGQQIHVRRLWRTTHIPKVDVLRTSKSFLDGIGVSHLRRFVFPFGPIYFVHEWSTRGPEKEHSSNWDLLASAAMAISGFFGARAISIHRLAFEAPHARILALAFAGGLFVLFTVIRKRKSGLANSILFAAGYTSGLIRM